MSIYTVYYLLNNIHFPDQHRAFDTIFSKTSIVTTVIKSYDYEFIIEKEIVLYLFVSSATDY